MIEAKYEVFYYTGEIGQFTLKLDNINQFWVKFQSNHKPKELEAIHTVKLLEAIVI
jgi:hypothetical protein